MKTGSISITLNEWESLGPENRPELVGRFVEKSTAARDVVEKLNGSNLLKITELRRGLQIKANSHVGRIVIGDLYITILPKIKGTLLLGLMRYAYGFRGLNLINESTHQVDSFGFEDLLISQLNAEVKGLISHGFVKSYVGITERLASPRGRIDLKKMALDGGKITGTLPCQHHPRTEDILLNRVLVAGLRLAASLAGMVSIRRESQRLGGLINENVSAIKLDGSVLDRAKRNINRLTAAYAPALSIIRILVEGQGVVLQGKGLSTNLPGFLFDMNAFFQALLSRFLRESLPDHTVHDEQGLKGMLRYNPKFNPLKRQSPTPRPDFVLTQKANILSIIDAKYRDLWDKKLPRSMLYQLVVYAISNIKMKKSIILYPTTNELAKEARINIFDPIYGNLLGEVCLRPVFLPKLEKLILSKTSQNRIERESFAKGLALICEL